jgi:hypothetical protein
MNRCGIRPLKFFILTPPQSPLSDFSSLTNRSIVEEARRYGGGRRRHPGHALRRPQGRKGGRGVQHSTPILDSLRPDLRRRNRCPVRPPSLLFILRRDLLIRRWIRPRYFVRRLQSSSSILGWWIRLQDYSLVDLALGASVLYSDAIDGMASALVSAAPHRPARGASPAAGTQKRRVAVRVGVAQIVRPRELLCLEIHATPHLLQLASARARPWKRFNEATCL